MEVSYDVLIYPSFKDTLLLHYILCLLYHTYNPYLITHTKMETKKILMCFVFTDFWVTFSLQIPQDRTIVRRVLRTVSLSLFVCMSTVSGCGILVAIALVVFNIWNNHRR